MAKISSLYTCHEVIVDDDGNFIKEYQTNLPHSAEIVEAFVTAWNKQANTQCALMNKEIAKNRVQSCLARQYKKNGPETTIAVDIVAKPGCQLRDPIRSNLFDWMDAQYADGWGESFFGMINVMTAKDGTHFYID